MQFNRSDSYTFNNRLPRLLNEESIYDSNSVIIHSTNDYDVVRFSSLYNMSRYNDCSIQECIDTISHDITKPLVLVVNENKFLYDEEYRLSVLQESNNYNIQIESNLFTFSSILESCIKTDLQYGTYYTDKLLESVVIPSEDPNGNPGAMGHGTLQTIRNGVDRVSANAYSASEKVSNAAAWLPNQLKGFAADMGQRALQSLDTEENREKLSDAMGKMVGRSIEKMTGAADKSLKPIKMTFLGGAATGLTLSTVIGAVNKLTSSGNMSATGENAAGLINTLRNYMGSLQNMQFNAPPQQQGIISRLMTKIKNAIVSLGRKMGL